MLKRREVRANGLRFAVLEAGSGPLALCLHGFPDTAHTWRHLLPELAQSGYHAVAPFMRGYAPTGLAEDGCYSLGAPAESCSKYEAQQRALIETPPQPTLYLHGDRDGCIGADLVTRAADHLSPESTFALLDDVGHFLHLEDPDRINGEILGWL